MVFIGVREKMKSYIKKKKQSMNYMKQFLEEQDEKIRNQRLKNALKEEEVRERYKENVLYFVRSPTNYYSRPRASTTNLLVLDFSIQKEKKD